MTENRRWRGGDVQVDLLGDGLFDVPRGVVRAGPAADRHLEAWAAGPVTVPVNAFLLRGPDGIALVDAGAGPTWGPRLGHAFEALAALGVAPGDVDRVYLTHIHGDHGLGLLAEGAATLPRAELLVPEADLAFFTDAEARAGLPPARHAAFDLAAALVTAYRGRLRPVPFGPVARGIDLVPLPGHTPGQGGLRIEGGGETLTLFADALHFADIQAPDPDFGLVYDLDPARAVRTRRALLAEAAAGGSVVAGGHVGGFGRVVAEGSGFRIVPA